MSSNPSIRAFYLTARPGSRFCVYAAPASGRAARGAVLYVHPFAEEMNKSRRMAAMQARQLAVSGYGVLQIDLFGCGDSSGEIRDASLDTWLRDLDAAAGWLLDQGFESLRVWGLRFGALLASHWAGKAALPVEGALLWQPVTSGEAHLNQFLRVGTASDMLTAGSGKGVSDYRKRLAGGESVEIGGYDIAPRLVEGLDALRLSECMTPVQTVDWIEVDTTGKGMLSPGTSRVADAWSDRGQIVRRHVVAGDPFWATTEITDCGALLSCTAQIVEQAWTRH